MKMIVVEPIDGGAILVRVDQILSATQPADASLAVVLSMVTGEKIKITQTMRELQARLYNATTV